jgi:TolB protein
VLVAASAVAALSGGTAPADFAFPTPVMPAPQDQRFELEMLGRGGKAPVLAIPSFTVLSADADTQAAARTVTDVLRADLAYEREFSVMPAANFAGIPSAQTIEGVPFDRWKELNAQYVALGQVQKTGDGKFRIEVRIVNIDERRQAFGQSAEGESRLVRRMAHVFSDAIHKQIRNVDGVATTRIAFASTRDGERVGQTIEERSAKEIYIMDYDGANQQRITADRSLNIAPSWCPDGTCVAYVSYAGGSPNIVLQNVFGRIGMTRPAPTRDDIQNWLPAVSPDGQRIAFGSARDGKATDIYVVNRDGSGLRQLTTNPAIDNAPRWSPNGTQIAFVSDRTGAPRIYTMSSDGLQQTLVPTGCNRCDRPTWAPSTTGIMLAYTSQTSSAGHDIEIYDFSSGKAIRVTDGLGTNESPSFAPNGRHILFFTTRWGKQQLAVIDIDGRGLRRLTDTGNNSFPSWSGFLK